VIEQPSQKFTYFLYRNSNPNLNPNPMVTYNTTYLLKSKAVESMFVVIRRTTAMVAS